MQQPLTKNFSFRRRFKISLNADVEDWYESQDSDISAWNNCLRADWLLAFYYHLTFDEITVEFVTANCLNMVANFVEDPIFKELVDLCTAYTRGNIDASNFCTSAENLISQYEIKYESSRKSKKDSSMNPAYSAIALTHLCLMKHTYVAVDTHKYYVCMIGVFKYIFYIAEQEGYTKIYEDSSNICRDVLDSKIIDYCISHLIKLRMR